MNFFRFFPAGKQDRAIYQSRLSEWDTTAMANNRADDRTSIDRLATRAKWRTSSRARSGPTRWRTGPTRIRTSALTNGRRRLNQSGEIWLSRASATRHVAWPRYLCASMRSRSRTHPGERRCPASSDPVIYRSLVDFLVLPAPAESIC